MAQCWHFPSFPITGLRDLDITWNLFPHVSKWVFAAVAGRLLIGAQPCHRQAHGGSFPSRGSSHSKTQHLYALSTIWHGANHQFGEPAELDPWLKDCAKHMVVWFAFHVDHPPCETGKAPADA